MTIASTFEWVTRRTRLGEDYEANAIPQPRMLSRVYATQPFCGEGRSLLNRVEGCWDSTRVDESQYPNNFPTLTNEQICELATAVCDDFGGDLSRAAFTEKLRLLLEDVTGFEAGEVDAGFIESMWGGVRRSSVRILRLLLAHQLSHLSI